MTLAHTTPRELDDIGRKRPDPRLAWASGAAHTSGPPYPDNLAAASQARPWSTETFRCGQHPFGHGSRSPEEQTMVIRKRFLFAGLLTIFGVGFMLGNTLQGIEDAQAQSATRVFELRTCVSTPS